MDQALLTNGLAFDGLEAAAVIGYSSLPPAKLETIDFKERLSRLVSHLSISMAIALGMELNLFEALTCEPASVEEIARRAALRPRYVREWLACMACGEVIEVDEEGELFWVANERSRLLLAEEALFSMNAVLPLFGGRVRQLAAVFKINGPLGLAPSECSEQFFTRINFIAESRHKADFVREFVPVLGVGEDLRRGVRVMDVGCGEGGHILELAAHFPASHFTGVDIWGEGIEQCRVKAAKKGLTNVEFHQLDASVLHPEWGDHFDLIVSFDSMHDNHRVGDAMAEIHRCLKPGGVLNLVEVNGTGNCRADKELYGSADAVTLYATSLFHCLPVGSNNPGSHQLGCMWSVDQALGYMEAAGFATEAITARRIDYHYFTAFSIPIPKRVLYRATKIMHGEV